MSDHNVLDGVSATCKGTDNCANSVNSMPIFFATNRLQRPSGPYFADSLHHPTVGEYECSPGIFRDYDRNSEDYTCMHGD